MITAAIESPSSGPPELHQALAVVACLLAYVLGRDARPRASVTTLTGVAYADATHQTEVTAGGSTYKG